MSGPGEPAASTGEGRRTARALPASLRLPPLEGPAWREFLLLSLVLLATFLWSSKPVLDPDTFWHLAVGREIWQTGHLVRTETFSFTAPGAPWVDEEWLFHVGAYPLWRLGGDALLRLLTAAAAALAAGFVVAVLFARRASRKEEGARAPESGSPGPVESAPPAP